MMLSLLKTIRPFETCSDDILASLDDGSHVQNHPKGRVLFIHGDDAKRFYFIKSGWVKIFRETLDGAQAVLDVIPQGNIFGEDALFGDGFYDYSAEVVENAEIVSYPLSVLKAELSQDNGLALAMIDLMARHRRQQDKEIEHRSIQNASQRIGCFILRLTRQDDVGRAVSIHLPYDKTLVAARLGMQPETFSRALSRLKEKTGIRVKGATIEMDDLKSLIEYSCAACSSRFPCKDL